LDAKSGGNSIEGSMSNSISTLLARNLHDVFGENDPVRRRAAINEQLKAYFEYVENVWRLFVPDP
jgi:hypothetical protein